MDMFRSRLNRRANGGGNVGIAGVIDVDTDVGTVSRTVHGHVSMHSGWCANDRSPQGRDRRARCGARERGPEVGRAR